MDVDQKDTLGEVAEPTLQQDSCRPKGRDGLRVISSSVRKFDSRSKVNILIELLSCDMSAVDMKWSLFVASASTYRFESCLKPFPPQYTEGMEKNIDKLRHIISQVPPLPQFLQYLIEEQNSLRAVHQEIVELLFWILEEQEPKFFTAPRDEHAAILQCTPSDMSVQKPNFIFQVNNKWSDFLESRWESLANSYGLIHAYHGSRLENFHSILRHGLQQHLNKNGLFGAGIYLSNELGVSLPYSLTGSAWSLSKLGHQLSCVALCDVINHPDVKCKQQGGSKEEIRSRALTKDSIGGEVPEKYFLVRNSDLVRVRYLLVYAKQNATHQREHHVLQNRGLLHWLGQHKMVLLFAAYIVLLLAISLGNSPTAQRYILRKLRQLGL